MELVLATRNEDKIREIKQILEELNVRILTFKDFPNFPTVEETGTTLEANAFLKARAVSKVTGKVSLADDSGLEVEALNGAPGIYSSCFAGENVSYEDNNRKLLSLLRETPDERRNAAFRCVMALVTPEGKKIAVEGVCPGMITREPLGDDGFGYDPVFRPVGYNKTFAQIPLQEKNKVSHRARALRKIREIIEEFVQIEDKFMVGLTGNMGCGKSSVADVFEMEGIEVIKADEIGHRVLEEGNIKKRILSEFGEKVFTDNGQISRDRIRAIAVSNQDKLTRLNEILHPVIKKRIWEILKEKEDRVLVVEAALIFEVGWDFFTNKTVIVYCSKEKQLERLRQKNSNLSSKEIEGLLKAQLSQQEKIKRADYLIRNDGSLDELRKKAKQVLDKILAEAKYE